MNLYELRGASSSVIDLKKGGLGEGMAFDQIKDGADFDEIVKSLSPSDSFSDNYLRLGDLMRAPMAAYGRVMESIDRQAPAGMPVLQAMDFYAQKQIALNDAKTLQNVVATFAKLTKKNIELVLNNK